MKIDDYEDAENGSFGDLEKDEESSSEGGTFPDEDNQSFSSGDDSDD